MREKAKKEKRMKEKDKFVESSFANRAQLNYRSCVIAKTINTM